jgi:alcohol dehydrogenase class IV
VSRLADRRFEMVLRNRVVFGVRAVDGLPELVVLAGGTRVFLVTDPGVRAAGIVDPLADRLAAGDLPTWIFDAVEPNPAAATIERGAAELREAGVDGTVVVAVGGGSAMDAAKAISGPSTTGRSGSSSTTAPT